MKTLIGIRREDKNPWERRSPLIPTHVREIIRNNPIDIRLQPSTIRVFPDEDYQREGARIEENLSSCSIILAVKEIPTHFFKRDKVYVFFSHTIKGQPYNMPMLKKMMDLGCTLIDYERIVDEKGQRLLFFGEQAGQAGMIDTLWALGQRLNHEKKENPFSSIKQAFHYESLVEAKEEIEKVGWKIHEKGFHPSLVPLVCGFMGYGHVSQGAQGILDLLPFDEIPPGKISSLYEEKNYTSNKLYKVVFKEEHLVEPREPDIEFQLQDYYDHPQNYRSIFDSYLPFLTILVNCIFWTPDYPRFVTKKSLKKLFLENARARLRVIGDISCDVEGSVEVTVRSTKPDNPVFVYDLEEDEARDGVEGKGPVIMAIDNLPAEISLESSVFFSNALKSLVPSLAAADFSGEFENCGLPDSVKKAVILFRGKLTSDYEYMKKFI
jgi:saccharopine dehydrogenase (NAD+, L-lysine-forming)